jgi:hypothetical protein
MEEDMPYKRITRMDIWEIVRRWHQKQAKSQIANSLGHDQKTIRKYIHAAKSLGIEQEKPLPPKAETLSKLKAVESKRKRRAKAKQLLEPHLEEIIDLVNRKENALKPKYAFVVICKKYGLNNNVSYSTFKRFVKDHYYKIYTKKVTCRIERPPGEELQIDYGFVGFHFDPVEKRKRKVYAFIGTLSYSRHNFVEFVYKQDQQSFVSSHISMFDFFEGIPKRIVLDNLKAGVIRPDLYDPKLNKAYAEMAEYYNCFLDPCRVGKPKDKGKVENQVPVFRQKFRELMTIYPSLSLQELGKRARLWCCQEYGHRTHGTTQLQPYPTFVEIEKPALLSIPARPFEIPLWKEAVVHPDHYIQFNKKAYSLPTDFIGKMVSVKGNGRIVQIFYDHELIVQHAITNKYRHTNMSHFPENIKAALDEGIPKKLCQKAKQVGPYFEQLITAILEPHAFINMRKAMGIVNLSKKFDNALLEKSAQVILQKQLPFHSKTIKKVIEKLYNEQITEEKIPISEETRSFLRSGSYFEHHSNSREA